MYHQTLKFLVVLLFFLNPICQAQDIKGAGSSKMLAQGMADQTRPGGQPDFLWEFHEGAEAYQDSPVCAGLVDQVFGEKIACLRALVDDRYNEKEQAVPGDPTVRMVMLKPDIYKAVKSIGKHYKKEIKNASTKPDLIAEYEYVLRVALAVLYTEPSDTFEEALRASRKNTLHQIAVFKKAKLL
ncbi:hypothetical protein CLV98_102284 [Dyadobacter jejuensis]|uniref:Secreted protein n=2 Tax=Dyadobacter jejuensis TaxID=1082580 RepID=A0A316APP5_9BACT|nr:hypothetical protein CLV98_102284 [Dyadobacter jejuensis]